MFTIRPLIELPNDLKDEPSEIIETWEIINDDSYKDSYFTRTILSNILPGRVGIPSIAGVRAPDNQQIIGQPIIYFTHPRDAVLEIHPRLRWSQRALICLIQRRCPENMPDSDEREQLISAIQRHRIAMNNLQVAQQKVIDREIQQSHLVNIFKELEDSVFCMNTYKSALNFIRRVNNFKNAYNLSDDEVYKMVVNLNRLDSFLYQMWESEDKERHPRTWEVFVKWLFYNFVEEIGLREIQKEIQSLKWGSVPIRFVQHLDHNFNRNSKKNKKRKRKQTLLIRRRKLSRQISEIDRQLKETKGKKFDGKCYNCGKLGHRAVNCRQRRKNSRGSKEFRDRSRSRRRDIQRGDRDRSSSNSLCGNCYKCGLFGHYARNCLQYENYNRGRSSPEQNQDRRQPSQKSHENEDKSWKERSFPIQEIDAESKHSIFGVDFKYCKEENVD